jgi:hypothetical protein
MPKTPDLACRLIRNVNQLTLQRAALEPRCDCSHARLGEGTAARKLTTAVNVVPARQDRAGLWLPGKRAVSAWCEGL